MSTLSQGIGLGSLSGSGRQSPDITIPSPDDVQAKINKLREEIRFLKRLQRIAVDKQKANAEPTSDDKGREEREP